ncbi:SRPBCC family protein [Dactylosporangium sp. CS-047395]|uniref:SRPBCC family protein n=1 Tax=Dactylosporangium sp. CS-047395 TaxID=3239936 RepID=UPI003D907A40
MTAELHGDAIVATVRIQAPPHVVFPYFTDPALIVQWIGEQADLDPRPGGRFFLDFGTIAADGAYRVVEPPHRVVFSWGIPGSDTLPPGGSTVEVVLTADGADTVVVLTHRDLPEKHLDDHRAGWEEQLGRLAAAGDRRQGAPPA